MGIPQYQFQLGLLHGPTGWPSRRAPIRSVEADESEAPKGRPSLSPEPPYSARPGCRFGRFSPRSGNSTSTLKPHVFENWMSTSAAMARAPWRVLTMSSELGAVPPSGTIRRYDTLANRRKIAVAILAAARALKPRKFRPQKLLRNSSPVASAAAPSTSEHIATPASHARIWISILPLRRSRKMEIAESAKRSPGDPRPPLSSTRSPVEGSMSKGSVSARSSATAVL
jgi:hypothetical protein